MKDERKKLISIPVRVIMNRYHFEYLATKAREKNIRTKDFMGKLLEEVSDHMMTRQLEEQKNETNNSNEFTTDSSNS